MASGELARYCSAAKALPLRMCGLMLRIVSGLMGRGDGACTRGAGATGGATQDLRFLALLALFCRSGNSFLPWRTAGEGADKSSSSSAGPVMISWYSLASIRLLCGVLESVPVLGAPFDEPRLLVCSFIPFG